MGAMRPPWIEKHIFYRMPYNFCDRWCEHCDLTDICRVYKREQESKKRAEKEGKDPNSMEFAFEEVHRSFQETIESLKKGAEKWGIDVENLEEIPAEEFVDEFEHDHLYKLALVIAEELKLLKDQLENIPPEEEDKALEKDVEIFIYYMYFVPAKIYRMLSSEEEEKQIPEDERTNDDKTSAFLARYALTQITQSLTRIASKKLDLTISALCFRNANRALIMVDLLNERFRLNENKRLES